MLKSPPQRFSSRHCKEFKGAFFIYGISLVFITIVWATSKLANIPMYKVVSDIAEISQQPFYIGFQSQVGIFIWFIGASICFFTLSLTKKADRSPENWHFFLWFSGLFTLFLGLDDWLQIHEKLPRKIFFSNLYKFFTVSLSGPQLELIFYVFYIGLFLFYITKFKSLIYQTRYSLILVAIGFFISSNIIDIFIPDIFSWHFTVEEGMKFMGIVSWNSYLWFLGQDLIRAHLSTS